MAGAFAQHFGGDKVDVMTAGSAPAERINSLMTQVMEEKGFDLAFRTPRQLDQAIALHQPEMIVTMGCEEACPNVPGAVRIDWDLADPAGKPVEFMQTVRDAVEKNVTQLLKEI